MASPAASRRDGRTARRAGARLAAGAAALALLAGCADLPGSSAVRYTSTQVGGATEQELPQQVAVPPGPGWDQRKIVAGFLAASASFAGDHAVAREYLTPVAARAWHPGWAATVVGNDVSVNLVNLKNEVSPAQYATASVTGTGLARLTETGQYLQASGAQASSAKQPPVLFQLQHIGGQWRIYQLPSHQSLIITESAFEDDYVSRNLYFLSSASTLAPSSTQLVPGTLVPDPVFVPLQESPAGPPVTGLVRALLKVPAEGWLAGAPVTAFPPGTTLLGVAVTATSAVVDLGGAAAHVSPQVLNEMEAQLVWTLTSPSYTSSAITSVQLRINGNPVSQRLLLRQQFSSWLPGRSGSRMYYLDRFRKISMLTGGSRSVRLGWPVRTRLSSIAVQPGGAELAAISPRRGGCAVLTGPPGRRADVLSRLVGGGACTALSVDGDGNVWVAAGSHVWFLTQDGGAAVQVLTPAVPPSETITDLRVAPDGVRVAMIVQSAKVKTILLGAISHIGPLNREQFQIGPQMQVLGSGMPDPTMLAWYNADSLVALSDGGQESSQLYLVPLNGGSVTADPTPVGRVVSIAAAGSEAGQAGPLIAGMAQGAILSFDPAFTSWSQVASGTGPVYPG